MKKIDNYFILFIEIIKIFKDSTRLEGQLIKSYIFFNNLINNFGLYFNSQSRVVLVVKELNIYVLEKAINEIAPELVDIYNIREDESEEQQIKTGRLHESRILGIMLKFYLEGKTKVTTRDVELEYKKYFKEIARSTISTYLNMLKKESTLIKERDGRVVYYLLREDPPNQLKAFWFTRLFCIDPVYYSRAIYFASLYSIADIVMQNHSEREFNGEI